MYSAYRRHGLKGERGSIGFEMTSGMRQSPRSKTEGRRQVQPHVRDVRVDVYERFSCSLRILLDQI